jgi:peptidylprolyl isomerase
VNTFYEVAIFEECSHRATFRKIGCVNLLPLGVVCCHDVSQSAPTPTPVPINLKVLPTSNGTNYTLTTAFVPDTTVSTASGLKYSDLTVGVGAVPKPGQIVTVNYTGVLENGTKFDSSRDRDRPFSFKLGQGQVIAGWDEGLSTMKVGGRRQLIIPASLAYGTSGIPGSIPPNATLTFDIELLSIT